MANLVRREEQGQLAQGRSEPAHWLRELMRFDPFQAMSAAVGGLAPTLARFMPDFEVRETPEAYVFKADIPGVSLDELEITMAGNRLIVSGRREEEERDEKDTYYAYERAYGSFTRAFTLPDDADADNVQAELTSGVLTLTVPKRPEQQPKKVEVKAGQQQSGQQPSGQQQKGGQQSQQPPKPRA